MRVTTGKLDRHTPSNERDIFLRSNLAKIPERLLLAHARGQVLFIAGAGVSIPSRLPDFGELVCQIYKQLDSVVYEIISSKEVIKSYRQDDVNISDQQKAEVKRFIAEDYDVVLGLLERRMDDRSQRKSLVRKTVIELLCQPDIKPASIHRSLMRLADRGGAVTMVTTNFDLLLEDAAKRMGAPVQSYALGGIPRPTLNSEFSGVMHIHGALDRNPKRVSDMILTDHDFGEFYLRSRVVSDFIYDAARLFHLVLVGYSANDPPMKYLFNAIAADGSRFSDIKERFIFVATHDSVELAEWKGKGITPVAYKDENEHSQLHETLERWALLSADSGKRVINAEIKRIVSTARNATSDADRDLFDHLIRRSDSNERIRLAAFVSKKRADHGWLDAIVGIMSENVREGE